MNNETNLYPAGQIQYSFKMYAAYDKPISCNLAYSVVQKIVLEKINTSDMFDPEWSMKIHFGPIHSIEEVDETGNAIQNDIFNMLSFTLNINITGIMLIGHGLTPRAGEGGLAHLLLPSPVLKASAKVECPSLSDDSLKEVQNALLKTFCPQHKKLISLFRCAIGTDEPIVQFLILYVIISDPDKKQYEVDRQILSIEPATPQSISPKTNNPETIYTRLRNEITHRINVDPEITRTEIANNLDRFRKIVHRIIELSL